MEREEELFQILKNKKIRTFQTEIRKRGRVTVNPFITCCCPYRNFSGQESKGELFKLKFERGG